MWQSLAESLDGAETQPVNKEEKCRKRAYAIYDELARGGVGTIITGFTSVAANDYYFEGLMRLCDDALISQYGRLTDIIHAQEAAAIAQLALGAY